MSTRERLARYAHEAWSGWMTYLFEKSSVNVDGSVRIPVELVERWKRQMTMPYEQLPPVEQDSDRAEADVMLRLIQATNRCSKCCTCECPPEGHGYNYCSTPGCGCKWDGHLHPTPSPDTQEGP